MMNMVRNIFLSYFLVLKDFMRCTRKRKLCYTFNFVNLKYLIHKIVLKLFIGFLAHSLLLINFKYPRPWRRVMLW